MRNGQFHACSLLALEQRWGGCAGHRQARLEAPASVINESEEGEDAHTGVRTQWSLRMRPDQVGL